MPPKHVWHSSRQLELHFRKVKADRKSKYGNSGDAPPEGSYEMRNSYADSLRFSVDRLPLDDFAEL